MKKVLLISNLIFYHSTSKDQYFIWSNAIFLYITVKDEKFTTSETSTIPADPWHKSQTEAYQSNQKLLQSLSAFKKPA